MRFICDNNLIFNAVMIYLGVPAEDSQYVYGFSNRY